VARLADDDHDAEHDDHCRNEQGTNLVRMDAARDGRCAARRQVEDVAGQCAAWAGPGDSFFSGLAGRVTAVPDSLRAELDVADRAATAATAELGAFLDRELMPLARENDACGPEVYARASRYYLGAAVDLREAYAWSWEELARLRAEMARVSNLVRPGATVEEAVAILDEDPARRVEGRENFRAWMQELAERTISELHGTYFDIPQPAHRIEAVIAPTSDGGMFYTEPSDDWSRPGRICWSVPDGVDAFSTWKEVTVVYHEGVPGHHLQTSHAMAQTESLNRWQRMSWVSGHGEGWALYAERLMGELGYLDDPGAGTPRSPGRSCAPTPAGTNGNYVPSYGAASACRARPPHTSLVNEPGCRPGRTPWHGPEKPSASRTFTHRHSAWALWVLTRCARRLPASKGSAGGSGRRRQAIDVRAISRVGCRQLTHIGMCRRGGGFTGERLVECLGADSVRRELRGWRSG